MSEMHSHDGGPGARLFAAVADFVLDRPRWTAALLLAALLPAALLIPNIRLDFTPQALFDAGSPRAAVFEEFAEEYGRDDQVIFLLVRADSLERPEPWALLHRLEGCLAGACEDCCPDGLRAPDGVDERRSVYSLALPRSGEDGELTVVPLLDGPPRDPAEAAEALHRSSNNPLVAGNLIAGDGRSLALLLRLEGDLQKLADVLPRTRAMRDIVHALRVDAEPLGMEILLGGPPIIRMEVVERMWRDMFVFVPVSAAMLALVLLFLFRSLSGVALPLLSCLAGTLFTMAAMPLTGHEMGILETVLPSLVLVIGAADAIHLLVRHGHETAAGGDRRTALRRSLIAVGSACFLTSFTTSIGFGSLLSARLDPLRSLGAYAAFGVLVTFCLTLTFVPWALAHTPARIPDSRARPGLTRLDDRIAAMGMAAARRPVPVLMLTAAVFVLAVIGIGRLQVDNFIMEYLAPGTEPHDTNLVIEEHLGGIVGVEILLDAPGDEPWLDPDLLSAARRFEDAVLADGVVRQLVSPGRVLGSARDILRSDSGLSLPSSRREAAFLTTVVSSDDGTPLDSLLNVDRTRYRISARCPDVGARAFAALKQRIRSAFSEEFPEEPRVSIRITGATDLGYAGIDQLATDLVRSLAGAAVVIFFVLLVLFRSLRWALVAMVPNLLPVLVVISLLGWAGIDLQTTTAMAFCIGLGIAVDDTIHLLSRYREALASGARSIDDALDEALRTTGRALLFTTVLLTLGFIVLVGSQFQPNRRFAVLGCLVMVAALICDLLVLPALIRVAGLRLRKR